jgi:DNA-binding MarR family transcriptional regulator
MHKMFRALKASSEFRRHHLPFLKTLEDLDLIREIGFNQTAGHPISLKQLFTRGIGSVATVQRRLARLKRLGVVAQTRADHDKRVVALTLTPHARRLHARWAAKLRNSLR